MEPGLAIQVVGKSLYRVEDHHHGRVIVGRPGATEQLLVSRRRVLRAYRMVKGVLTDVASPQSTAAFHPELYNGLRRMMIRATSSWCHPDHAAPARRTPPCCLLLVRPTLPVVLKVWRACSGLLL